MIQVDDRVGSVELVPFLQDLAPQLCHSIPTPPIKTSRLLSGDVAFDGVGRDGGKIVVGVERKRLGDMVNSMRSGRYEGSQLPGMSEYYDRVHLIIEGRYRCNLAGDLEKWVVGSQSEHHAAESGLWRIFMLKDQVIRYTELDHLICRAQASGVRVRTSGDEQETAAQIISLYTQYQKPFDKQIFNGAIHTPQTMATVGKASLVRRVAATLSGIGWERSGDVALKFGTVKEMMEAGPAEWETIRGVGKTLARRAYDQLRGDYKDKGEL